MNKNFFKILVLIFLMFICVSSVVYSADTQDLAEYKPLLESFEKGEQEFKKLKAKKDQLIKNISKNPDIKDKDKAVKKVLDDFYDKSRQLAEQYRKPLVDKMVNDVNADLPESKRIKKSAGTPLHIKDKKTGKKILNPKHRGWEGDTDFGASPHATDKFNKKMKKLGLVTEGYPGHLDVKRLETTVNNEGRLGDVGSEAHKTQVIVDTNSKETYSSVAMKKNQAGKKRVLIGDHYKKAVNGLKHKPDKLLDNMNDFQGMVKGTLKSANTAKLTDEDFARIIADSGYKGSIEDFKNKLEVLKSSPEMAIAILEPEDMESFQKACKNTLDTSVQKTEKIAQKQIVKAEKKVKSLEYQAKQAELNGDTKTAKKLKQDAQLIREDIVDSKMRIEATKTSIDAKLRNKTFNNISPDYKIVDTPDAPSGKKGIKFDVPAAKFGGAYMKLLDMKGNVEDFKKSVYQAIDEEQEGDSELKTWAKATGYTLLEMSGIPAMKQVYDQLNQKTDEIYKERIKQIKLSDNPVIREMQKMGIRKQCEDLAKLEVGATVLKGMIEEGATLAGDTGTFLGELSSDGDEEEINAQINRAEAKFISYNSQKFRELKQIMKYLHENGYDEEKALKRDELNNYFFQLSISRAKDENLSKYTERWVEEIQHDTKLYNLLAEQELHKKELEEQEFFFEEVDQKTVERNKQILESQKRQQENRQKNIAGSQSLNDVGSRQAGIEATQRAAKKIYNTAYPALTKAAETYTEQKNAAFRQKMYSGINSTPSQEYSKSNRSSSANSGYAQQSNSYQQENTYELSEEEKREQEKWEQLESRKRAIKKQIKELEKQHDSLSSYDLTNQAMNCYKRNDTLYRKLYRECLDKNRLKYSYCDNKAKNATGKIDPDNEYRVRHWQATYENGHFKHAYPEQFTLLFPTKYQKCYPIIKKIEAVSKQKENLQQRIKKLKEQYYSF